MDSMEELLQILRRNDAGCDVSDIQRAYEIAAAAHEGQKRESGDPFISHPVSVAIILADLGMDADSLVAALLHDVVEDTSVPLSTVEELFGEKIALLVDGVTKLGKIHSSSKEERQAKNIEKMLIAMAKDVRVIVIKLADRLHNMRTIGFMPPQNQRNKARETMEVYVPIANRLGIHIIKEELEDLCLRCLDPVAYQEVETLLEAGREERDLFIGMVREKITNRLGGGYPAPQIDIRVKSVYQVYRKMYIRCQTFDEIYDVCAVRVITGTAMECYQSLGEIHNLFRPIHRRFKDYISTPKPNMYQSLHTTVVDKNAIPFLVQIRTRDMHRTAQCGILARWKYHGGLKDENTLEGVIAWVGELLESQKDAVDVQEIIGNLKTDLATDEVYAFTPKGDLIALPAGSTVIDFAYAIHSEVGNQMTGAKVDGRMVLPETKIQTGNIVKIITDGKGRGPSREWLEVVRMASTRSKIRAWFKRECNEENTEQGRMALEKELRRNGIGLEGEELAEVLGQIAREQQLNSPEELLAAVGYGGIALPRIMPRVKSLYRERYGEDRRESPKAPGSVIVEGMEQQPVRFAKCCAPLPGDEIVGYLTKGYGVTIHKKDCVNVQSKTNDADQQERWVDCRWAKDTGRETFPSTVEIVGKDNGSLILEVTTVLNGMKVRVYGLSAKEQPEERVAIQITLGAANLDRLMQIIAKLEGIPGVERVERMVQ